LILRIVRLLDTSSSSSNQNVVHKIRIQYFDRRKPQDLLGKRDITCTILSYKPSEQNFDDEINNPPSNRMRTGTTNSSPNVPQQETRKLLKNKLFQSIIFFFFCSSGDPLVIFILIILGAISAFILILPTIPDNENSLQTRLPSYLHMTTNSKVIASYILGKIFKFNFFFFL